MSNIEIWKPIPEFENCGEISNLGRIRSSYGKIRKTVIGNNDYVRVGLKKVGAKNTNYVTVHRLVAKAFCEGFGEGLQVNHKDGDKTNNVAENLEWTNGKNNIRHSYRLNLRKDNHRKPTIPHEDREYIMSERAKGITFRVLAERYGVNVSSMVHYVNGRKRKTIIHEVA